MEKRDTFCFKDLIQGVKAYKAENALKIEAHNSNISELMFLGEASLQSASFVLEIMVFRETGHPPQKLW